MIDVGGCLSPLSRFLRECPEWTIIGGAIAAVILIFVILKVVFRLYTRSGGGSTYLAVLYTLIAVLVFFVVGYVVWEWNARTEERRMYELMGESYGIEQLECSDDACTWLKDGQPAAGTLVRRDDKAGLLDSDQKPLPLVDDEATRWPH